LRISFTYCTLNDWFRPCSLWLSLPARVRGVSQKQGVFDLQPIGDLALADPLMVRSDINAPDAKV
jgi:hypothetical protein